MNRNLSRRQFSFHVTEAANVPNIKTEGLYPGERPHEWGLDMPGSEDEEARHSQTYLAPTIGAAKAWHGVLSERHPDRRFALLQVRARGFRPDYPSPDIPEEVTSEHIAPERIWHLKDYR